MAMSKPLIMRNKLLTRSSPLKSGKETSIRKRESTWMSKLKSRTFSMKLILRRRSFLKERTEFKSLEQNLRMPRDKNKNLKMNQLNVMRELQHWNIN